VPDNIKLPEPVAPIPSPVVSLPAETMAQADLRNLSPAPVTKPRGPSGPPAPPGQPDTPLVDGRGPNGERLYAASWYREPYDGELRGYLSTAQPGWALIACQTVEDFRVDHCVALDEWPNGSQMARAVLAAAWQFKVRPPRVGGQVKVGEWVRIRIDYGITRKRS
jgi:protein TonB